jgi:hypothetical protein
VALSSRFQHSGVIVSVFVLAFVPRVVLAVLLPGVSPDGVQYLRVAENIVVNGCISLSDPASGACVPHWGGNHPPGYPVVIAATWLFTGISVSAILIMQSAAFALSLAWLTRAITTFSGRPWVGFIAGAALAVSPLQLAWGRLVLPDMLAVAGALWVLSELILSIHEKRLRAVQIALALSVAFFSRYDGILLIAPVVAVAFLLHSPLDAIKRGVVCALIFAVPILVWTGRNTVQGLSFVPDPFLQDGGTSPKGYLAWGNTWIVSIYDGGAMAFPLQVREYDRIEINERRAFANAAEKERVESLLDELRVDWIGKPFPLHIDSQFAEIAALRRQDHPINQYVILPLRRTLEFWGNPFYSFAWPLELDGKLSEEDRAVIAGGTLGGLFEVALRHPVAAFGKAGLLGYRSVLLLLVVGVGVAIAIRKPPWLTVFIVGVGYVAFRTAVLSYQPSIDSRYMISGMAILEVVAVVALVEMIGARRDRGLLRQHPQ